MEAPKPPLSTAEKIAEELFRTIEREKRINKGEFVEVIEKVMRACAVGEPAVNPIYSMMVCPTDGSCI